MQARIPRYVTGPDYFVPFGIWLESPVLNCSTAYADLHFTALPAWCYNHTGAADGDAFDRSRIAYPETCSLEST